MIGLWQRISRPRMNSPVSRSWHGSLPAIILLLSSSIAYSVSNNQPGLLFYLSADKGFVADHAMGNPHPSVINDIEIIPDGAVGQGFRCANYTQIMAYWAAGNIYAQRGTLGFSWRARDPIGRTPFPIFQVSYSDHSSIDMAWLRVDFNGQGFDAFVTDVNLARARVSYPMTNPPGPEQWVYFTLSWDENHGVRFYIDGKKVGQRDLSAVFDAGLDQFGAHGDVIGPQDVATMEQFLRGGDLDEIQIYDQMLSDENIDRLARGKPLIGIRPVVRRLDHTLFRDEWFLRYGWNRPQDIPPYLGGDSIKVRKVEIHEVYDLKQWIWKATDGIRETTWPGVYNRSRLPGRTDYFIRPDWNCYTLSGRSVTLTLPQEPWNHVEISGGASGPLYVVNYDRGSHSEREEIICRRPRNQERTFHQLEGHLQGGRLRFVNEQQEMPIGEIGAYYIVPEAVPQGLVQLHYVITAQSAPDYPVLDSIVKHINGRFMDDERSMVVALPEGAPLTLMHDPIRNPLPLVHILVPFEFRIERPGEYKSRYSYTWENLEGGLDGIALDLPPMSIEPSHGDLIAFNLRVKDPLWPDRNMLDVTFSLRPDEPKTLWLDTRDRILPNGYSLYLTMASAAPGFGPQALEGARLRLIFKDFENARTEHEADRFTQIRDNVGNFLEWGTNRKFLKLYTRFSLDIADLFRVNPHHPRARYYWSYLNGEQGWPPFDQPEGPEGVPLWAFRQLELVRLYRHFINWWIDERQIANGEFGGGLSDDGDLTNYWPGAALMGIDPDKFSRSVHTMLDTIYDNGMITNGLNTIMADDLHTYEEGFQVQGQCMLMEYGNPKTVERMMETARELHRITGINDLGERQIRSGYFSAGEMSTDPIWAKSKTQYSYLMFHPAMLIVDFNDNAELKQLLLELADGLIAHRTKDPDGNWYIPGQIFFPSGENVLYAQDTWATGGTLGSATHLLWAAWRWTGDEKYLQPILDRIVQGKFGILRALNANVIDLLDKRESWGEFIALTMSMPHVNGADLVDIVPGLKMSETDEQTFLDVATNVASASLAGENFYRHVAWQVTGNKRFLEDYYADQIQAATQRMPMFTEDHWWVDRVNFPSEELQRSRLGGVALVRSATYQGHIVSWRFLPPATAENLAVLVSHSNKRRIKILAFNPGTSPVTADLTFWDLDPGLWRFNMGVDSTGNDVADTVLRSEQVELERTRGMRVTFPPKKDLILEFEFVSSIFPPPRQRPDLGISREDIVIKEGSARVTVHSLGSVESLPCKVALIDAEGRRLAVAELPGMDAPRDLRPRTKDLTFSLSADAMSSVRQVQIDPDGKNQEITKLNNKVSLH